MKKLKSICLAMLTVILAVAMLMGTLTLSAFAAVTENKNVISSPSAQFARRVQYGVETDVFAAASKVISPNGTTYTTGLNKFTPYEVGVYTVYYGENYSYNVSCYIDGDYELRVEHNGADLPTYTEVGKEFTVPNASVWFKADGEDKYVELTKDNISDYNIKVLPAVTVKIVNVDKAIKPGEKTTIDSLGTFTVHYAATVGGEKGTKYLSKDYTVKVQQKDTVNDTVKPSLTVVNVPGTLPLNAKVELPKGTATDNYDENVKVEITVTEQGENDAAPHPVNEVELNDDGYATSVKENTPVKFDNEYNRVFYPTDSKATYRITYIAYDDFGNATNESTYLYSRKASDSTAPVLKEIADEQIPTRWGATVTNNGKSEVDGSKIKFPYPTFIDNSGNDGIQVSFEIKNTTDSTSTSSAPTVIRFEDIYDQPVLGDDTKGKGSKYVYSSTNGAYNPAYAKDDATEEEKTSYFAEDGFTFDFNIYAETLKKSNADATVVGSYVVTYQAKDKAGLRTTKTYDIAVEETYTDTAAPVIDDLNWQENYLVFTKDETEFTLPTVKVNDTDTRPEITYELFDGDINDVDGRHIAVNGGEVAKLQMKGDKATLTVEVDGEDRALQFTTETLVYRVTATDDVGNKTVKTNVASYTDDKAEVTVDDTKIAIVTEDKVGAIAAGNVTFNEAADLPENLTPGQNTTVGSFEVTIKKDVRKYYGFELSLYTTAEEDGQDVTKAWTSANVELYTYYDGTELHIKDIKFAAPKVKSVTMFLRIYDVAGNSYICSETFAVNTSSSSGGGSMESALEIGTTGSVYTSYLLKNRSVSVPDENMTNKYVIRKINGVGRFSLMGGSLFTAYNAGTFTFAEYYDPSTTANPNLDWKPLDASGSYDWKVTETATPAWQMQGEMPTYTQLKQEGVEGSGKVYLPMVVASTEFANAKITLDVAFQPINGSKQTLNVAKKMDNDTEQAAENAKNNNKVLVETEAGANKGKYYFIADKDGTYTLTYTATYGDNATITQTHTVKAGDVIAPQFSVNGEHKKTASENSRFKFFTVTVGEDGSSDRTNQDKFRYTKSLIAPDGSTVFTVDGTGKDYREGTVQSGSEYKDGYKFTKTGPYTVRYEVTDQAGNKSVTTYTVTVSAAKVNNPVSTKIISTVLIIVGVLLIAGVILYFVRFRKVKAK